MEEIWKDVKGYEVLYQVSNFGNVKSLIRNKILRLSYSHNGYRLVSLQRKTFRVHRLVAEAFFNPLYDFEVIKEDKKIRKIKVDYSPDIEEKIFYEDGDKPYHYVLGDVGTELLINKINEIIDYIMEDKWTKNK